MACARAWTAGGWRSPATTSARPRCACEILDDFGRERRRRLRRLAGRTGDAEAGGDRSRQGRDVARLQRQPVVGLRAGVGRDALGDVEPGHPGLRRDDAAPRREVPRVAQLAGTGVEQVGVEREDHVGLVDAVDRLDVLAERLPGAGARVVARRSPRTGSTWPSAWPSSRPWICAASVGDVTAPDRMRSPAPPAPFWPAPARRQRQRHLAPGANLALAHHGLRAVRIVERRGSTPGRRGRCRRA